MLGMGSFVQLIELVRSFIVHLIELVHWTIHGLCNVYLVVLFNWEWEIGNLKFRSVGYSSSFVHRSLNDTRIDWIRDVSFANERVVVRPILLFLSFVRPSFVHQPIVHWTRSFTNDTSLHIVYVKNNKLSFNKLEDNMN
jgi:hypothetical protein